MTSRQEAFSLYTKALKSGQKCYHTCVHQGRYPYPQALEEILSDAMVAGYVDLGVVDVPLDQIAGTKLAGRRNAFAANFMPLLDQHSEFAEKWIALCEAHLGDAGIRDPIRCYEYMGRFYVQEGNKRVSVLKSFDAVTIPGYVTRVLPMWSEAREVRVYYEFLEFYKRSRIYRVRFRQPGDFARLQAALGFEADHDWTEEERRSFLSAFAAFQKVFRKVGGDSPAVTTAEAMLAWLQVYPLGELKTMDAAGLEKSLRAIWADVTASERGAAIAVSTAPEEPEKKGLGRLVDNVLLPNHLNVAFFYDRTPEESGWLADHDRGRAAMERAMEETVTVKTHFTQGSDAAAVMEKAVEEGAQVLVAPTPPLIAACRRTAAKYPQVRVLNCSVAMPYTGVRTYHCRMYEGAFLAGAAAGAVAREGRLGYLADNPLFGVPASVNAFALGARLTNPQARVVLDWSCLPGDGLERLRELGAEVVYGREVPGEGAHGSGYTLFRFDGDGAEILFRVESAWGRVYTKLMTGILHGGWDSLNAGNKAVNYWWGFNSGAIAAEAGEALPDGVAALTDILRRGITEGTVLPFHRKIRSQDGAVRNDGNHWFSPEEILYMDWLCDAVEGRIPPFEELDERSKAIVRLQGLYRDSIPPEKEGGQR